MIEGIFGQVRGGKVIGWAFDKNDTKAVTITVKDGDDTIVEDKADKLRPDLLKIASHVEGKVGFEILVPKGKRNWSTIELYANEVKLNKTPNLINRIGLSTKTLSLDCENPHFFIHLPKTAGTAFKKLLENQFASEKIFPSAKLVSDNGGMYPLFHQLIKLDPPAQAPELILGHYPYATHNLVKGNVSKTVIFREPVQRAISNIFHMKNNDSRLKDLSPMEIYVKGRRNFVNYQIRYLADKHIHLNMRFIDSKPINMKDLKSAIANMRTCKVVGISEQLDKTVRLANKVYGWNLKAPGRVNIAKSKKDISDELMKLIIKDNKLEQRLYNLAIKRFDNLCTKFEVT